MTVEEWYKLSEDTRAKAVKQVLDMWVGEYAEVFSGEGNLIRAVEDAMEMFETAHHPTTLRIDYTTMKYLVSQLEAVNHYDPEQRERNIVKMISRIVEEVSE